jgi:hypothetical protein
LGPSLVPVNSGRFYGSTQESQQRTSGGFHGGKRSPGPRLSCWQSVAISKVSLRTKKWVPINTGLCPSPVPCGGANLNTKPGGPFAPMGANGTPGLILIFLPPQGTGLGNPPEVLCRDSRGSTTMKATLISTSPCLIKSEECEQRLHESRGSQCIASPWHYTSASILLRRSIYSTSSACCCNSYNDYGHGFKLDRGRAAVALDVSIDTTVTADNYYYCYWCLCYCSCCSCYSYRCYLVHGTTNTNKIVKATTTTNNTDNTNTIKTNIITHIITIVIICSPLLLSLLL